MLNMTLLFPILISRRRETLHLDEWYIHMYIGMTQVHCHLIIHYASWSLNFVHFFLIHIPNIYYNSLQSFFSPCIDSCTEYLYSSGARFAYLLLFHGFFLQSPSLTQLKLQCCTPNLHWELWLPFEHEPVFSCPMQKQRQSYTFFFLCSSTGDILFI